MPEPARRSRVSERLERALEELPEPLEVLAWGILGESTRIDAVARDGRGGGVVLLWTEPETAPARLTEALAQRAWVAARLADWDQLAPHRGLRPELGVRIVLVGRRFDAHTRTASASLGEGVVSLHRLGVGAAGPGDDPETIPQGEGASTPRLRSVFRTGLRPSDL